MSTHSRKREKRSKHPENLDSAKCEYAIQLINTAFSPTLSIAHTQVLQSLRKPILQPGTAKVRPIGPNEELFLLRGSATEHIRLTPSPTPHMSSGCSLYHFLVKDLPRHRLPQARREFTGRSLTHPLFHDLITIFFKDTSTKATVLRSLSRLESTTFQTNAAEPA